MKTYSNYQISSTSHQHVFLAFKSNAKKVNGISFSHLFYFQYSTNGCDIVNDKKIIPFEPSFNENYFQSSRGNGIVLSKDLESFVYQDNSLGYVNYQPISIQDAAKLEVYEN